MAAGKDFHREVRQAICSLISTGTNVFFHSQLSWEVIIVDDNSPDGTQEIAKQLANVYGEDKIVTS